MTSPENPLDVAVVGAGIVGVSTALFLLDEGHEVTLVDPRDPGTATSFGNAGVLAASTVVPIATPGIVFQVPAMLTDPTSPLSLRWTYLPRMLPWLARFVLASGRPRMERHSRALRTLVEHAGAAHDVLIQRCGAGDLVASGGWLKLARSKEAFERKTGLEREFLERYEVPFEVLEGDAIREIEPCVSQEVTHALHLVSNRRVKSPLAYTECLFRSFSERGGRHLRKEVWGFEGVNEGATLLTEGERHHFDRVVIAAGAHSRKLAAEAGHRVPLDTERGYHVTLPMPEIAPERTLQAIEPGFVMAPMQDGLRITSGVELAGLRAAPNYSRVRRLVPLAARYIRGISPEIRSEWMGYRPSLPDGLPVIGRSKRNPAVFFAFGHNHLGLTLGPLTGRIIADLIAGRDPDIDLSPYAPDRRFF